MDTTEPVWPSLDPAEEANVAWRQRSARRDRRSQHEAPSLYPMGPNIFKVNEVVGSCRVSDRSHARQRPRLGAFVVSPHYTLQSSMHSPWGYIICRSGIKQNIPEMRGQATRPSSGASGRLRVWALSVPIVSFVGTASPHLVASFSKNEGKEAGDKR